MVRSAMMLTLARPMMSHPFQPPRRSGSAGINIDINVSYTTASWQDRLISILFEDGHRREADDRDNAPGARCLSVPPRTASGESAGATLRRRVTANGPQSWAIFVDDVVEPGEAGGDEGGGVAPRDR